MYAIIQDSGTQIKVQPGAVLKVATRELQPDAATITFDKVLLVNPTDGDGASQAVIGAPYVKGAKVTADILAQERTASVPVVKFRRRKGYLRRKGHRQDYLRVKITSIES